MPASDIIAKQPPPPFNVEMSGPGGTMHPMWQDYFNIFHNKTLADLRQTITDLTQNVSDLQDEQKRNGLSASSTIPSAVLTQLNTGSDVLVTMILHDRRYDDGVQVTLNPQSVNVPYSTEIGFYYVDVNRLGGDVVLQHSTDLKITRVNYVPGQASLGVITTIGPTTGGATASQGTGSAAGAWVNPANAAAVDGVYTTQNIAASTVSPNSLIVANFGSAIPVDATITGIEVKITRFAPAGIKDVTVRLQKAGVSVGANKANVAATWPTTTITAVYGGAADMWGTTWTPAEINAATFGVELNVQNVDLAPQIASVDAVTIVAHFTQPNTVPPPASGGITPPGWNNNTQIP